MTSSEPSEHDVLSGSAARALGQQLMLAAIGRLDGQNEGEFFGAVSRRCLFLFYRVEDRSVAYVLDPALSVEAGSVVEIPGKVKAAVAGRWGCRDEDVFAFGAEVGDEQAKRLLRLPRSQSADEE